MNKDALKASEFTRHGTARLQLYIYSAVALICNTGTALPRFPTLNLFLTYRYPPRAYRAYVTSPMLSTISSLHGRPYTVVSNKCITLYNLLSDGIQSLVLLTLHGIHLEHIHTAQ